MTSSFPWATALMLMGALQGFLLFAALLRPKTRKPPANRLLAVLMLLAAIRLLRVALMRLHPEPGGGNGACLERGPVRVRIASSGCEAQPGGIGTDG